MKQLWTNDETLFLRENYGEVKTSVIAVELDRTEASTRARARKIGLVKQRKFAITVSCKDCGKEFKRSSSAISPNKHQFCSRRCYYEWKKTHPNTENLGEPLRGRDHPEWKEKIVVRCTLCGDIFHTYPYREKEGIKYCSLKCYWDSFGDKMRGENNPNWKGGHEWYYGLNWYEQRGRAIERDHHICQICGVPENGRKHDVHHIVPFREFSLEKYEAANRLENLITVCHSCHMNAERMGEFS